MKILYYTDQTYMHGGIERVLANKINYLVEEEGIEVFLITTEQKSNNHCYTISPKLNHFDLNINYNRNKSYFNPKNFIKIFKHFNKLKNMIDRINPDVIITVNYDYAFYFIPFLHKKSKKIKEYHSSRYFEGVERKNNKSFLKKMIYKLNDFIESKYNHIVLLTKDEKQHFKSNNTIVIPNGIIINTSFISKLTSKQVISAGRIAPVKGFDKLIDAWVLVNKQHPDWKLKIYGEGENEYLSSLKNKIDKYNLQDSICFCGQTNNLEEKMLNSSIYVMSSVTECFPMVLLESKNIGLPIISFDCPYGPRNIISDKTDGFLVKNQNSTKLAEAILNLINNNELRLIMGNNAKNNAKELSQNVVMKKWINLFKNN